MIFLNNRLVADKEAKVSIFDHGFLYGDGVYDTLRVYNGTVFMADEHIKRLFRSAKMIRLSLPLSHDAMKRAVYRTLKANRHHEAYVRISVSRGPGPIGLDPELCHMH
jgi:branched-chain amino acid aminotransferase